MRILQLAIVLLVPFFSACGRDSRESTEDPGQSQAVQPLKRSDADQSEGQAAVPPRQPQGEHEQKQEVEEPVSREPIRKWTDSTGGYTVEASFVDFSYGKVRLKKTGGKVIVVPIKRLTEEDQRFVWKEGVPPKVQTYLKQMKARQAEVSRKFADDIRHFKKEINSNPSRGNPFFVDFMRGQVSRLEALRRAALKKQKHVMLTTKNMKLGQIGVLYDPYGVVVASSTKNRFEIRVAQVSNATEMFVQQAFVLPNEVMAGNRILVRGVSTKGVVDDMAIELPQVFEVTDTETYGTADGGTNTVFVVEPIDIDVEPYLPTD